MNDTERYERFNEMMFEAYCKTCIDRAVLKERERKAKHYQREIPFSSFADDAFERLQRDDISQSDGVECHIVYVAGMEIPVYHKELGEAISSLVPKDREIIMRYYFLGKTDDDIAAIMNMDRATVQRHRNHAAQRLRLFLEDKV